MRKAYLCLVCLCWASLGPAQTLAETITKCQDVNGKWHYGDYAAQECEATISELSPKGTTLSETGPPPTQGELDAQKEAEELAVQEAELAQQQAALDQQLLSVYENEASIINARDQRLSAIDKAIQQDQTFKSKLQDKLGPLQQQKTEEAKAEIADLTSQIQEYDQSISGRMAERDLIRKRYDKDLTRYRALTQQ